MDNLKIVRFVNFTSDDFVGKWGSVPQLIPAGESVPMEDWRAKHYAKHLINRELQQVVNGNEVYPGGSKFTSPRKPEDHEIWRTLLAKCIVDGGKRVPASHAAMEVLKEAEVKEPETKVEEFKCDLCEATSRTKAGISAHRRSHKE